ncbi:DUF58 domain-containing protein [Conexibacter sp. SYSU D00693]|uniref:DUF58 domain-containing protein n=1 Tax=Conexibacter sp. SYSU D00693 TaxID=2812560 RepID=UPI00196AE231|nr:DUF58 domain-containing protein [Conexibacter sp. SYSU D00693]
MGGVAARPAAGTALLGAALVGVAGLLDAEPLYVPGIAFLLLALCAAGWVLLGTRDARVHREVPARRVVEDEPLHLEVVLRAGRPLPAGELHDALLDRPAPLPAGRAATRVRIDARFARRGRKALPAPRVALRDPFGMVTRTVQGTTSEDEVLVLPRVEEVRTTSAGGEGSGLGTRRGQAVAAAEVELDGVRQHRPGTPASRIYWPALARRGELLERRMRADGDARPLVVLDPRGAASAEDLDAAVRATASIAVHLARQGGCAVLVPGDRRPTSLEPGLAAWPHLHARLALVEGEHVPALGAVLARVGEVVLVSARRVSRAPRALAQAPRGGRILVVPAPLPGRRALFAVAGCTGYELSGSASRAREAVA